MDNFSENNDVSKSKLEWVVLKLFNFVYLIVLKIDYTYSKIKNTFSYITTSI